jgi:hypothetical protein
LLRISETASAMSFEVIRLQEQTIMRPPTLAQQKATPIPEPKRTLSIVRLL